MGKLIIGLGSGRCGTVSLSEHLNIWHEFKTVGQSLYMSETDPEKWLRELKVRSDKFNVGYGDISLDHIHNLDYWLGQEGVELILLIRDREETANSIKNYRTRRIWKRLFPDHDFDTLDGIYRFWDWYYETCFKHEDKFAIISPDQLPIRKNTGEQNR